MPWSFWTRYVLGLATVALLLVVAAILGRRFAAGRFVSDDRRTLFVLESVALTPHASVHVVKAGDRCLLIGAGNAAVTVLTEFRST